ncbi:hypothetical protein ACXJDW_003130 [Vibrio cholerae]
MLTTNLLCMCDLADLEITVMTHKAKSQLGLETNLDELTAAFGQLILKHSHVLKSKTLPVSFTKIFKAISDQIPASHEIIHHRLHCWNCDCELKTSENEFCTECQKDWDEGLEQARIESLNAWEPFPRELVGEDE